MTLPRLALILALVACGSKPPPAPPAAPPADPEPAPVAAKVLVNVDDEGVAINGFDPVGYVKDGKVTTGAGENATQHGGATYWFASAEHKAAFDAEPAKFTPQYGGYCAYAASQGRLSPIQPEVYEIYEGQLLLFTNKDFKASFDKDPAKHKAAADQNWPGLVEKHGKVMEQ